MNLALLASFILFILWLAFELSRRGKTAENTINAFWENESMANRTRRKPLDTLDFVVIPIRALPTAVLTEDGVIADCLDSIHCLCEQKIVNLTGITNTELKLTYGAPNLPALMEYDQNYTRLARTLQSWANRLYECACFAEAVTVLEFAVSTGTDISASYALLARLYRKTGSPEKLPALLTCAQSLRSASRPRIERILQESGQYNG